MTNFPWPIGDGMNGSHSCNLIHLAVLGHADAKSWSGLRQCVGSENIRTPTTEGIGNSKGVVRSKTQETPGGEGDCTVDLVSKILSYLLSRSFI